MLTRAEVRRIADANALKQRHRRALRRVAKTCVNGSTPATNGIRCLRCHLVKRLGAVIAHDMQEWIDAPRCAETIRARCVDREAATKEASDILQMLGAQK